MAARDWFCRRGLSLEVAGVGAAGGTEQVSCRGERPEALLAVQESVGILRLRESIRIRESAHFAQDDRLRDSRLTRPAPYSPASRVRSVPPMSCVVFFCRTAPSTAASILSDSFANPKYPSIMAAVRIAPNGFATFFPAIGGAEPCTGSNIDVSPGWIFSLACPPHP